MAAALIHYQAQGYPSLSSVIPLGEPLCGSVLHVEAVSDALPEVTCIRCLRHAERYEQMNLPLP